MLAAAEALPDHPKHAERLWDAGQCFQNAHLVGQALKARASSSSRTTRKIRWRRRRCSASRPATTSWPTTRRRREYYEDFANKFPGEKKATDALGNATTFRIGLGESDKAIADMDSFVKFYGTRKPQDAAGVYFQMGEVYEKEKKIDDLARHLDTYLKKWGAQGGPGSPGPGPLPSGRDGLEGVVPEGVGGRRLPGGQARRRHRPPEGPLRHQQEAARRARRSRSRSGPSAGRPPARRSPSSTATRAGRRRARSTSRPC